MPVGRKPKPTALKLLQGNPGRRPINDSEPQPRIVDDLKLPIELDRYGKYAWRKYAPVIQGLGLFTEADVPMFMLFCDAYSQWRHSLDFISGLRNDVDDYQSIMRQVMVTREKARSEMRLLATEFGMSPSSRSRLSVAPQQSANPFEEFLNDGRNTG